MDFLYFVHLYFAVVYTPPPIPEIPVGFRLGSRIPVGIPDSGWIPVGFRLGFRIPGVFRWDSGWDSGFRVVSVGIPVLVFYLTVTMFLYLLLLNNSRNTYSRHLKFGMVIVIHVIYKSKQTVLCNIFLL